MLLVVGLGNPGREYAAHRHNVGFQVLDELARRCDAEPFRSKFSGKIARLRLPEQELVLLKPETFMNAAGSSVQPAAAFFRVPAADVVVVHDELDLPLGTVRLKHGGGHAGHNGLRSIVSRLGTADFGRIRVGIGRPPAGYRGDVADYVLSPFSAEQRAELPTILRNASQSVLDIAARGFAAAMKIRNTRPSKKRRPADDESRAGEGTLPPDAEPGSSD